MRSVVRGNLNRGIFSAGKGEQVRLEFTTPEGTIGQYYETEEIAFQLLVSSSDDIDHFELVSGELPEFVQLLSDGLIFGEVPETIPENTIYEFTIRVIDVEERFADRTFNLDIRKVVSDIQWLTPEGNIGTLYLGQSAFNQVEAESTLV
ncbi:hypothetical protein D3C87_768490 [compost metagenome]